MPGSLCRWTLFGMMTVGLGGLSSLSGSPSASAQPGAQVGRPKAGDRVLGQYIVVFKDQVADSGGRRRGWGGSTASPPSTFTGTP